MNETPKKRIIGLKINLSKVDKTKLFQGSKGTYLDCTLFLNDTPGHYGDNGMITQDVSQEDRAQGIKGEILGNGTIRFVGEENPQQQPAPQQPAPQQAQQQPAYSGSLQPPSPAPQQGGEVPF